MTTTNESKSVRRSYKITEDSITFEGVANYYNSTIQKWAKSVPTIESARFAVKDTKNGKRIEIVIRSSACRGEIHITTNSTASIDYRKIEASYEKKLANRVQKEREQAVRPARARKSGPTKAELAAQVAALQAQIAAMQIAAK